MLRPRWPAGTSPASQEIKHTSVPSVADTPDTLDNHSIVQLDTRVCQTWSGHPGCPTLLTLFTQQHKLRVQSQTGAVPPECRPQTVVIMPEISTRDNENQGETRRGRGAPFIVLSQAGQLPPKYDDLNTHCAAAATSAGPGVKCAFETFLAWI